MLVVGTIVCLVKLVDLLPQYTKDAQGITDQIHDWLSSLGLDTESTSDALKKVQPVQGRRHPGQASSPGSSARSAGCSSW